MFDKIIWRTSEALGKQSPNPLKMAYEGLIEWHMNAQGPS